MTVPLFLSACGADTFYVEHATFSHIEDHRTTRTKLIQGIKSAERVENFVIAGHRITADDALVLAYRTFSPGAIPFVDQAHFEKLTILLPANVSNIAGDKITFQGNSEAIVFWSKGSANFPGKSGCYGYGSSGALTITSVSDGSISAVLDLTIQSISPAGWKTECGNFVFRKSLVFARKRIQDLTPWDGTSGAHIYDESIKK